MKKLYLEKCMRIISDIVSFCHHQGAEEFQIYITHDEKDSISSMTVSCPMGPMPEEVLENFSEKLNIPRQHEIEQNYWELSGETEMSGELALVGMMIDDAKVGYKDGVLHIHAWRKD